MPIVICRVAWMPGYQSDDEPAIGGGRFVDEGNVPHESLNFLPIGETYYGFVENGGKNMAIENLGARKTDAKVAGVSVVFCATDPDTREFLVTGWYTDATVNRSPIERPGDARGREAYFSATDATLIGESERCFSIPRARGHAKSPFGGIGMGAIWYGLNKERAADFRESLERYMTTLTWAQTPDEAVVESRKRRISERLERQGSYRHFIAKKGYRCEACGWGIDKRDQAVWGASFELHHLTPFSELKEGQSRRVSIEDFAVLCASCHRAIHRTDCVGDIDQFMQSHVPF